VIQLARPRDVTELFRDTFGVFFRHAWVFIALAAAVVVPVHLVVEGIGLEMLTGSYDSSPSLAENTVPTLVDFLVVSPIITAICIHALRAIAEGRRPRPSRALVSGFEAFTPLFFAVLLAALGIAAGFVLLILPGVYLFVRWFFVPQAVVIENARGWPALVRSGEVVQGFWWRAFGLVLLITLAVAIPGLLLAAPFASIADSTGHAYWALAGTMLAAAVTAPVPALYSIFLYYDLLARRLPPGY
jgi:hypothetical protein